MKKTLMLALAFCAATVHQITAMEVVPWEPAGNPQADLTALLKVTNPQHVVIHHCMQGSSLQDELTRAEQALVAMIANMFHIRIPLSLRTQIASMIYYAAQYAHESDLVGLEIEDEALHLAILAPGFQHQEIARQHALVVAWLKSIGQLPGSTATFLSNVAAYIPEDERPKRPHGSKFDLQRRRTLNTTELEAIRANMQGLQLTTAPRGHSTGTASSNTPGGMPGTPIPRRRSRHTRSKSSARLAEQIEQMRITEEDGEGNK